MGSVTSRDVAREAGVSQNTVSLVARGSPRVREETRRAVQAAMERLGYQPNAVAAALRTRTTRALAFVIRGHMIYDHITAELLAGAIDGVQAAGYSLLTQVLGGAGESPSLAYRRRLMSGALCLAPGRDDPIVADLAAAGCPTVSLIGRSGAIPPEDSVVADDAGGAAAAVRHLVERGHRRLGLVALPWEGEGLVAQRVAGARGVGAPLEVATADGWGVADGLAAARDLLARSPRPTAVFAISDRLAFGVLAAAAEAGLAVPRDLAVVGFDNSEWSRYCAPPLTTVEFPLRAMARAGVRRLLAPASQPPWRLAPARLVVRESA